MRTHATRAAAAVAILALIGGVWSASIAATEITGEPRHSSLIGEIESLTELAATTWPEEFGISWYKVAGQPREGIVFGFTSGSEEKVRLLAEGFSEPSILTAATIPKSEPQISREMNDIINERERANIGNGPLAKVDEGHFDMDADLKTGEILVMKPKITETERTVFSKEYPESDFRFIEQPLGQPDACTSRTDCIPQIRGGLQARNVASPYSTKKCSTGFTVWANSKLQVLSAAHCSQPNKRNENTDPPYEARWTGLTTTAIGEVVRNKWGGRHDVERISVNSSYTPRGWIYRTDTTKDWPITEKGSWSSLSVDARLCRVGNTTGYECGDVLGKHYSPDKVPESKRFIRTNGCSEGGDSGGPWFRDHKAWGVHAGSIPEYPSCERSMQNFFGVIDYALDAMNAEMVYYNP